MNLKCSHESQVLMGSAPVVLSKLGVMSPCDKTFANLKPDMNRLHRSGPNEIWLKKAFTA